jgi:hypothetical protein
MALATNYKFRVLQGRGPHQTFLRNELQNGMRGGMSANGDFYLFPLHTFISKPSVLETGVRRRNGRRKLFALSHGL